MLAANPFPGGAWATAEQELLLGVSLHQDVAQVQSCWREWFRRTQAEGLDEGMFRQLPLALYNMRRLGLDDPFFGRMQGIHRKTWVQSQQMFHAIRPALAALVEAQVSVMIMKGAPLSLGVYPDAGCRPMRDIDILVPEAQLKHAIAVLAEAGWSVFTWTPPGLPEEYLRYRHGIALRKGEYELDIHWHFSGWACHRGADQVFWQAAEQVDFLGLPLLRPSASDQLLQLAVHGMEWNEIPPMRWVADTVLLLRSSWAVDWARVLRVARDYRLILPLRAALAYLTRHFEVPVAEATLVALGSERVTGDEENEFRRYTAPFPSRPGVAYLLSQIGARHRRARFSPWHALSRLTPVRFIQYRLAIDSLPQLLRATLIYAGRRLRRKLT
jgi:hypothetical protein